MPGKLSTHVLDLTTGRPAAGMLVELWIHEDSPRLIKTATTNSDGRTDDPLLSGAELDAGTYEIVFFVRRYFESGKVACPFLYKVPVQFVISDTAAACHVPLLVSPWAYSTYRGS